MTSTDLPDFARKLCGRAELLHRLAALPRPLVFTNGVLNSDTSARRLGKGPDRPLNNEIDRAMVIASLESVSLVTWFDEDTPLEIISEIKPDLLVKGGDYDMSKLAETRVVLAYGGTARALPFVDGYSTTALVKKIRQGQA